MLGTAKPGIGSLTLRALTVVIGIQLGLLLVTLPWTRLWDNNYWFSLVHAGHPWIMSRYLRGAVSGLGILNLWIATSEIVPFRV